MVWSGLGSGKGKVQQLCVTREEAESAIVPEQANGAACFDVNADHLAVAHVSGDGRLLGVGREEFGADRHGVQVAVHPIGDQAAARGAPLVGETLESRKKMAWLWPYGNRFGSILSNFRSRRVMAALERQCCRRGVELIVVDPAWTKREIRYQDRCRIGLQSRRAPLSACSCGFRDRETWLGPCRAHEEPGLAPRSNGRGSAGYARPCAIAVAARHLASHPQQARGSLRGFRRFGLMGPGMSRESGCGWPGTPLPAVPDGDSCLMVVAQIETVA